MRFLAIWPSELAEVAEMAVHGAEVGKIGENRLFAVSCRWRGERAKRASMVRLVARRASEASEHGKADGEVGERSERAWLLSSRPRGRGPTRPLKI